MQDIAFGQERVRAWPSSRGRPKTKAQKEAQDKFALVQKMAAYLAPGVLAYIHKAVANSPLLPRDVVTMMLYHRWMVFDLEDGRTLWPMTAYNDVSEALDVITKEVGDYLVRTHLGWRGASTLPSPPQRVKTLKASLSGNVPGGTGFVQRFPFNVFEGEPTSWWVGAPFYGFKPDTPGVYFVELYYRRLAQETNEAFVWNADLTKTLLRGPGIGSFRASAVSGMLYLDGFTSITSGAWASRAGTVEGGTHEGSYFKITGPF